MVMEDLSVGQRYFLVHISLMLFCLIGITSNPALASKCLFISSYHSGYAWSDGIERGLRKTLNGLCEISQFDMDSKRQKDENSIKQAAIVAKSIIEEWKPDVVIAADDNAAKYVIQSYYKDAPIPFVFCGINWDLKDYDLPYSNTTGMIEVAPIGLLINKAIDILGGAHSSLYIGANTLTERKNLERISTVSKDHNIILLSRLVSSTSEWRDAYIAGQQYDFIIIGSNSGIKDWDTETIKQLVHTNTRKLSMTNHGWMMPYTLLGFTKNPEEQGVWAGNAALAILKGAQPSNIPITSNKKWDIWINDEIFKSSKIDIPDELIRNANKVSTMKLSNTALPE
jgi:ABC-type uncharacterized transport system substrate-binding protein